MLKQQTISTSLGQLSVTSLTLSELRQLEQLLAQGKDEKSSIGSILKYVPIIYASARKVHQDLTMEQLENGLTLDDFNALFDGVMTVSGLKGKEKSTGEALPQPEAAPV